MAIVWKRLRATNSYYAVDVASLGYTFGGYDSVNKLQDNDQYDATGDSWVSKTDMPSPARQHMAAVSVSSKGYSFGGEGATRLQDCDEFDPTGNSWDNKTDMPSPARQHPGAFAIGSYGYSVGGYDGSPYTEDNDQFDPTGNSWVSKQDMSRDRGSGASWADGTYGYFAYGTGTSPAPLSQRKDIFRYDPTGNSWNTRTDGPLPTRALVFGFYANGKGYVGGGSDGGVEITDLDEYNATGDSWTSKADLSDALAYLGGSNINDKGYIYYGYSALLTRVTDCDEYDPVGNSWADKTNGPAPARNRCKSCSI